MTDKFTLPKIPSKLWNIGGEGRPESGKESKTGSRRELLKVGGLKSPRGEQKGTSDPESPRSELGSPRTGSPRTELSPIKSPSEASLSSRSAKSSAWREETLKNTQTTTIERPGVSRPPSQTIDRQV
jgi:hypothetical protein